MQRAGIPVPSDTHLLQFVGVQLASSNQTGDMPAADTHATAREAMPPALESGEGDTSVASDDSKVGEMETA